MKLGYQKFSIDHLTNLSRDTITLISHHDKSLLTQFLRVDILSVEQGAVNRHLYLSD